MTLAQIGRVTREHEATVSRHLARTRKTLRAEAERRLRADHRLLPTRSPSASHPYPKTRARLISAFAG